jgi:capsular polysaccharide export protein
MPAKRSYLFLQGIASRFFGILGSALAGHGHAVHRINFNGGDWVFWRLPGAVSYRWGLNGWPEFLEAHLDKWAVTDIVLFGDCRPLHREAVRIAKLRGIRVYVFDEGYIRPNWITMEQGGVNGHSSLPSDPAWFRAAAAKVPAWSSGPTIQGNFARRAFEDVLYNVATMSTTLLYPGFRTHRPWHPLVEYAGWLLRFSRKSAVKRRMESGLRRLATLDRPYYFFPLQLDCDSQIRHHSTLGRIAPAIHHVIASFARYAPPDSLLVLKEHPLDNALTNWRRMTARIAAKAGVGPRVIYLEDANLEALIAKSKGVVTVNSTVGFLALAFAKPVVTLGDAIYDMPDLTFQGGLDDFWEKGAPPDAATFDAFRRVAVSRTQINGGFFSQQGLELAVAGALARLEQPHTEAVVTPMVPPNGFVAHEAVSTVTTLSRTH